MHRGFESTGCGAGEQREAAPSIVKDYDQLLALSLDEEQAYLLMFVDGQSSASAIARASGLPVGRVRWVIRRLVAMGAVAL
ncbi:MAG TPA: helix-turn-helix domain-containing protein [Polyangiaceae bacterium]